MPHVVTPSFRSDLSKVSIEGEYFFFIWNYQWLEIKFIFEKSTKFKKKLNCEEYCIESEVSIATASRI